MMQWFDQCVLELFPECLRVVSFYSTMAIYLAPLIGFYILKYKAPLKSASHPQLIAKG